MTGTLTNTGWIIQCHVLLSYPQILLTTKKLSLNEVLDLISKVCACAQLRYVSVCVCLRIGQLGSHTQTHIHTVGHRARAELRGQRKAVYGTRVPKGLPVPWLLYARQSTFHSDTQMYTHTHTHTHTHMEDSILPAENTHHMEVYPPIAMYCQHTYTKPIYAHSMWTLAYSQHKHDFSKEHDFS